jgi:hypothetical protein
VGSFLNTLAARALGDLPVVRPRQPSRFEPVISADVGPLDPLEIDEMAAGAAPAWGDPGSRRETAPPPMSPPVDTASESWDEKRSTREEVRTTLLPAAPPLPIVDASPASAIAADVVEAAPPASRHRVPTTLVQARSLRPQPVRRPEVDAPITPAPPTIQQVETPVLRETAVPIVAPTQEPPRAIRPVADAATSAVMSPRGAAPRRDGSAESAPRRDRNAHQEPPEHTTLTSDGTAPTIVVSIGRIEVRASRPEPPRPVARAPRPQPRLTLDAFLGRQGRGR